MFGRLLARNKYEFSKHSKQLKQMENEIDELYQLLKKRLPEEAIISIQETAIRNAIYDLRNHLSSNEIKTLFESVDSMKTLLHVKYQLIPLFTNSKQLPEIKFIFHPDYRLLFTNIDHVMALSKFCQTLSSLGQLKNSFIELFLKNEDCLGHAYDINQALLTLKQHQLNKHDHYIEFIIKNSYYAKIAAELLSLFHQDPSHEKATPNEHLTNVLQDFFNKKFHPQDATFLLQFCQTLSQSNQLTVNLIQLFANDYDCFKYHDDIQQALAKLKEHLFPTQAHHLALLLYRPHHAKNIAALLCILHVNHALTLSETSEEFTNICHFFANNPKENETDTLLTLCQSLSSCDQLTARNIKTINDSRNCLQHDKDINQAFNKLKKHKLHQYSYYISLILQLPDKSGIVAEILCDRHKTPHHAESNEEFAGLLLNYFTDNPDHNTACGFNVHINKVTREKASRFAKDCWHEKSYLSLLASPYTQQNNQEGNDYKEPSNHF